MEAAGSSETFVLICQTAEHHISEDSNHIHHPENLKSYYKHDCRFILKIMQDRIITGT
jgi:hypothetical protein